MKKSLSIVVIICLFALSAQAQVSLSSASGGWNVSVNPDGTIATFVIENGGREMPVAWHTDRHAGPAWEGVDLLREAGTMTWSGWRRQLRYSISYADVEGHLEITASIENRSGKAYKVNGCERLVLGIDNAMNNQQTMERIFFPTMLRCEQTHFWGYFQNPEGAILTISSPDAVASWSLAYIGNGHNISTTYLDLMHAGPLPERHPQGMDILHPGETKMWRICLQPAGSLSEVAAIAAANCRAPFLIPDVTTAAPGEQTTLVLYGKTDHVEATDAAGNTVPVVAVNGNHYSMTVPDAIGNVSIISSYGDRKSETLIHVRKPWSWYLRQARSEALRMQIKAQSHREGWMGLITAYLANAYFPDQEALSRTEQEFARWMATMTDSQTGGFRTDVNTWHSRPQNTSWMVDLMNARYAATGDIEALELSSAWADRLISDFQLPDGAFKGYTALTLGSKFLQDLIEYEAPLARKDKVWAERRQRHVLALELAAGNILTVRDLGETEGEATYEDNQAGSAWSLLAMHAIHAGEEERKDDFLQAAKAVQQRHSCLTQAIIPDGRMRGGTLRFWESQYDILTPPNMMNSPHGWTMRSQFGAMYLYLLTGEEKYLDIAYNAMGACAQAIDETSGELRWAFVPDPYVDAQVFTQDPFNPGRGIRVPEIIGEQWMPMVSDWWRVPDGEVARLSGHNEVDGFQNPTQGWSCDNDVHFHFITLADEFIPNAFVIEREDGIYKTYNCSVQRRGRALVVTPAEDVVKRVHLQLRQRSRVQVNFASGVKTASVAAGMQWLSSGVTDPVTHAYLK